MSLFNLEDRCVMSSGSCATCTILISRFFVGMLKFVVGQLDSSCVSHCGPFHHNVADDKLVGSTPLEMRSAGLDSVGTYLQVAEAVSSCIKATLLPTKVFHLFVGPCIHVKAMEESVYRWESFTMMLRARKAFLYNLASNVVAHNSNLGIVSCFNGATFEVGHGSSHDVLLLLSLERMYRQAP